VLVLILYNVILEFDKRYNHKNSRIITLKAYFELIYMKNKYLCHLTLTRLVQLHMNLNNFCMAMIDQQYLLELAESKFRNKE
jgi:hypothetical protein